MMHGQQKVLLFWLKIYQPVYSTI